MTKEQHERALEDEINKLVTKALFDTCVALKMEIEAAQAKETPKPEAAPTSAAPAA
jgi:hypothetical protein